MARRHTPQIGEEAKAGQVTAILPPSGASRATRIEFLCRHCRLLATTRWTKFKTGRIGSCGCTGKEAFFAKTRREARSLSRPVREEAFEIVELQNAEAAARILDIDKYVSLAAWVLKLEKLLQHPKRKAILAQALESDSFEQVAKRFHISVGAVKRIVEMSKDTFVPGKPWLRSQELYARLWEPHRAIWNALMSLKYVYSGQRPGVTSRLPVTSDQLRERGEFSEEEMRPGGVVKKLASKIDKAGFDALPEHLKMEAKSFLEAYRLSRISVRQRKTREFFAKTNQAIFERDVRRERDRNSVRQSLVPNSSK